MASPEKRGSSPSLCHSAPPALGRCRLPAPDRQARSTLHAGQSPASRRDGERPGKFPAHEAPAHRHTLAPRPWARAVSSRVSWEVSDARKHSPALDLGSRGPTWGVAWAFGCEGSLGKHACPPFLNPGLLHRAVSPWGEWNPTQEAPRGGENGCAQRPPVRGSSESQSPPVPATHWGRGLGARGRALGVLGSRGAAGPRARPAHLSAATPWASLHHTTSLSSDRGSGPRETWSRCWGGGPSGGSAQQTGPLNRDHLEQRSDGALEGAHRGRPRLRVLVCGVGEPTLSAEHL